MTATRSRQERATMTTTTRTQSRTPRKHNRTTRMTTKTTKIISRTIMMTSSMRPGRATMTMREEA